MQCESYKSLYPTFLHDRIITIPNPVFPAKTFAKPDQPDATGRYQVISVGRLSYQKNYVVLIEAFAKLATRFPQWDLVIWGEGEERPHLQRLVQDKQLEQRIKMPGVTTNVTAAYTVGHLFCLPSLWEGFPNSLAEAMAHGLPAVGFADCSGICDLIGSGKTGLLAQGNNDSASLAQALAALMASHIDRLTMGKAAISRMRDYEPNHIFDQWQSVLSEVAEG